MKTTVRAELTEALQRERAQFANYRRRSAEESQQAVGRGKQILVEKLLPLLDDLDRAREHGDLEEAFSRSDVIIEETYRTHHQEHLYLETNGMFARPRPDGGVIVEGSLQCPYYVARALAHPLMAGKVANNIARSNRNLGQPVPDRSIRFPRWAIVGQVCSLPDFARQFEAGGKPAPRRFPDL